MKVKPQVGSPSIFLVESFSLMCENSNCQQSFDTTKPINKKLKAGDQCRKCGAVLREKWHRVDIAEKFPIGECGCEDYRINRAREINKLTSEQRSKLIFSMVGCEALQCKHIKAARFVSSNLSIMQHIQEKEGGKF